MQAWPYMCVYKPHAVGTGTRGRETLLVWFALGFLRQGIILPNWSKTVEDTKSSYSLMSTRESWHVFKERDVLSLFCPEVQEWM